MISFIIFWENDKITGNFSMKTECYDFPNEWLSSNSNKEFHHSEFSMSPTPCDEESSREMSESLLYVYFAVL